MHTHTVRSLLLIIIHPSIDPSIISILIRTFSYYYLRIFVANTPITTHIRTDDPYLVARSTYPYNAKYTLMQTAAKTAYTSTNKNNNKKR